MLQSVAITGGCILVVVLIAILLSIRRVVVLETAQCFEGATVQANESSASSLPSGVQQALRRTIARVSSLARWSLRSPSRGTNRHCWPYGCGKTHTLIRESRALDPSDCER